MENKKRLLTGIQPSGEITIGNYCGSIQQLLQFQENYESFVFIPDMHTITVPQSNPKLIQERIRRFATIYLACGLDSNKCNFFIQSEVPQHAQLSWILECHAYMGELSRMTQYKDKSAKYKNIGCGLFTYPVLMASDILLYDADIVPVGQDQKQHVELARDLAQRFNTIYGQTFKLPEPMIAKIGAKIKGLQNPIKKMSKSTDDKMDSIFMLDSEKDIITKINRAVTDSEGKVYFDEQNKPGISNLITLYSALTKTPLESAIQKFDGMTRYGDFKKQIIEAVLSVVLPFQEKYNDIYKSSLVDDVLDVGAKKAREIAGEKYETVRKLVGFGR